MQSLVSSISPRSKSPRKKGRKGTPKSSRKYKSLDPLCARDFLTELATIHSSQEIHIDFAKSLNSKRGDLAVVPTLSFRCSPVSLPLSSIPLVVKKLTCVDRKTYDLKVYEIDAFQRFRGHPNILTVFSYWSETSQSQFMYKDLVLLLEGASDDLSSWKAKIQKGVWKPSEKKMLRLTCDLAKALLLLHNCRFVHGHIKPSAIFLNNNTAMLGELRKVDLDIARQTRQLFSRSILAESIPQTLIYWSPELLQLSNYGVEADLWAIGVTLFTVITGVFPFPTFPETAFRDAVLSANVNWEVWPQEDLPNIRAIVSNLIQIEPYQRWSALEILTYSQLFFAVDIQRVWRGVRIRRIYLQKRKAIILIQSIFRAKRQERCYILQREKRKMDAILTLQSNWRMSICRRDFHCKKRALMQCQANVKTRIARRRFLLLKQFTHQCQNFAKTYLCKRWLSHCRSMRAQFETRCFNIQNSIKKFDSDAKKLMQKFPRKTFPASMKHLESFESFELAQSEAEETSIAYSITEPINFEHSSLPLLCKTQSQLHRIKSEFLEMKSKYDALQNEEEKRQAYEKELVNQLGDKYDDFKGQIEAMKARLVLANRASNLADYLPIALARPYTYSNWEKTHEPENIIDNVLKDDETVWRAISPDIDLELDNGHICFIAHIELRFGDSIPRSLDVFTSDNCEDWFHVATLNCSIDYEQAFSIPGETLARNVRLGMHENQRGGHYITIRRVNVRGMRQKQMQRMNILNAETISEEMGPIRPSSAKLSTPIRVESTHRPATAPVKTNLMSNEQKYNGFIAGIIPVWHDETAD